MSMIEELGDQLMQPMRNAVGDALAVAEEQARRYRFALDALNGNYPGAQLPTNGHANGYARAMAQVPVAALVEAPAESEDQDDDPYRVDPRVVSLKDLVAGALKSAGARGFVGVTDIPGAMKAFEVVELMDAWGWRDRSLKRAETVMSTLAAMAKDGTAVRVDRGTYVHSQFGGSVTVLVDEQGEVVDPNAISIKALVGHVMRAAQGEALRPQQVVARMEATGWRNRNEHRANTVRSLLARMMMNEGTIVRPSEGVYAWNTEPVVQGAAPATQPAPAATKKKKQSSRPQPPGRKPRDPNAPTGAQLVLAVLQGAAGRPLDAREVHASLTATGWTSSSARPLGVVQACLAQLVHDDSHVTRPELGQYLYTP